MRLVNRDLRLLNDRPLSLGLSHEDYQDCMFVSVLCGARKRLQRLTRSRPAALEKVTGDGFSRFKKTASESSKVAHTSQHQPLTQTAKERHFGAHRYSSICQSAREITSWNAKKGVE